ncbi:MAG: thioredoxin domain-containing protein [Bryobacteraceae bacterium]|nr:thioredoxin domain-containing protein [Bryobacteraceae bacterium]
MTLPLLFLLAIVPDVRVLLNQGDLPGAVKLVEEHRRQNPNPTPETIEAVSWLARGHLNAKKYKEAEEYAGETYKLALAELAKRPLDAERRLPMALGAAIEVQGQVMAANGERDVAVRYLEQQLAKYRDTSMRARIQKNINLLTLTGKPVPKVEAVTIPPGRPALLFFWAHWCGDCKSMPPILARIQKENPRLLLVGPTQRYGYVARGEEAPPEAESKYIEEIRKQFYAGLFDTTAPISEENFRNFGASTTPTIVLVNARGIVTLYRPGKMTYEDLSKAVTATLAAPAAAPRPASRKPTPRAKPSPPSR